MKLNKHDLSWCVRRLPKAVRDLMKKKHVVVAGGYIRACIANEKVNDIDMFCASAESAKQSALQLVGDDEKRLHTTENAITIKGMTPSVQFITRWVFDNQEDVIASFDWTICQASFWWERESEDEDNDKGKWRSHCSDDFYPDLAARRLIYTYPNRVEAPGGSLLRVLKYYQRGYRTTLDSLAGVVARAARGVDFNRGESMFNDDGVLNDDAFRAVFKGLLEEVDPSIDPDHIIDDPDGEEGQ